MPLEYSETVQRKANFGRVPDFLIIGAAKSGTTALWHQIGQHPQIFMHHSKHLNYFSMGERRVSYCGPPPQYLQREKTPNWEEYCSGFGHVAGDIIVGETCNTYLYDSGAAELIRRRLPDVKLIAILRNPAERAHSRYLQLVRSGREPMATFEEALINEPIRIGEDWWPEFHYLKASLYYEQLVRYFNLFPRQNIHVVLYDDMLNDQKSVVRGMFGFLGVDDKFTPSIDIKFSASGLPRSALINWTLERLRILRPAAQRLLNRDHLNYLLKMAGKAHTRNLVKPAILPSVRALIVEQVRGDVLKLQDLIGRDLSVWLR